MTEEWLRLRILCVRGYFLLRASVFQVLKRVVEVLIVGVREVPKIGLFFAKQPL